MTYIADSETSIVRYMSLSKFYSIITDEALWFPRIDQFSDEYEGFAVVDIGTESADAFRKMSCASCWNEYQSESFPLWRIYLGGEQAGVAVVSKVGKLMSSIKNKYDKEHIEPYIVEYVDPRTKIDQI